MGFMFLKKQKKLLLVALMAAVAANISGTTVYSRLNIDNQGQSKKQKIVKELQRQ